MWKVLCAQCSHNDKQIIRLYYKTNTTGIIIFKYFMHQPNTQHSEKYWYLEKDQCYHLSSAKYENWKLPKDISNKKLQKYLKEIDLIY